MAELRVTQVRSGIGARPKHRGTLRALGLGRIGRTRTVPDRPEIRGMLAKVPHLVTFETVDTTAAPAAATPADAAPAKPAAKAAPAKAAGATKAAGAAKAGTAKAASKSAGTTKTAGAKKAAGGTDTTAKTAKK